MQKIIFYFFVTFLLTVSCELSAQPGVAVYNPAKGEKEKLLRSLKAMPVDSTMIYPLSWYVETEVNSIYSFLKAKRKLSSLDKEKAERSLEYFIKELAHLLEQGKMDLYEIPAAMNSYKTILTAILSHQPLTPLLVPMGPQRSQLMAVAFSQYKEYSLLDDVAVYKRVASSPEYILQFLEKKPGFRYADSLLWESAADDPLRLVAYLKRQGPGLQNNIRNSNNIYVRQIATLSNDKQVSELLPFTARIAESRITTEEILSKRLEAPKYFQLLVNTLQESITPYDPGSIFLKPLRRGVRQKALSFYVNEINELHNSGEATRFASVKGMRPQDIYYIITSCGDELYTSSYLGLYKRLMENFREQQADSLFEMIQYDNFHLFIRLAANYNVLVDFMQHLSPEKKIEVLHRFISGIEKDESTALERAMDIADSFAALGSASEISELIRAELQSNLRRCTTDQDFLGIRLYSILSTIFNLTKQENGVDKLWSTLGDYEILKHTALENNKGQIVELVLFYGDEDGIISFNNFLKRYTDNSKWEITKNANWVSIRSRGEQSLVIYANRPLEIKQELDLKAQDSLMAFLKEQSLEPVILVHRGHSYHLDKTMKRLTGSVKLAILGSCGGYNKSISIAAINPDVQVIGSKKTGSGSINDPILEIINETLADKKDLNWPEIWNNLSKRFMKDEQALALFNEYFPPSHNLGLFVLKLFKYYNRFV
ncbi:MAG: hypothetical protein ABIT05_06605 [Chitinophagaceae bacterium]